MGFSDGGHIQKFVYRETWLLLKQTHTHNGRERERDKRVRSIINRDWRLIAEFLCSLLQITIFLFFFFFFLLFKLSNNRLLH
jgi:hypothetical protein